MAQHNGCNKRNAPPPYDDFKFSDNSHLNENYDSLLTHLDGLESSVESLRAHASKLQEEKEGLTRTITRINEQASNKTLSAGHREELLATSERIMMRLLAVSIRVDIPRSESQEEAYARAKQMLEQLHNQISQGIVDSKKILESYLNACSSEPGGAVDSKFQSIILSCTVDDQKQVRKCLHSWVSLYEDLHKHWLKESKSNMKL